MGYRGEDERALHLDDNKLFEFMFQGEHLTNLASKHCTPKWNQPKSEGTQIQ